MIGSNAFDTEAQVRHRIDPRNVLLEASPDGRVKGIPRSFIADANVGDDAVRWFTDAAVGCAPGNEIVVEILLAAQINGDVDPFPVGVLFHSWLSRGRSGRRHHRMLRHVQILQLIRRGAGVAVRKRSNGGRYLGHAEPSVRIAGQRRLRRRQRFRRHQSL